MAEPLEGEVCRRENHPLCMTPDCPCYDESEQHGWDEWVNTRTGERVRVTSEERPG